MRKYNYVYRITNKVEQKHYYGVRGCNVAPKLDLGIKYFSSSHDKEFKDDQKNHPENYKYKIVRICSTRKEADKLEIKLQKKFDVGINDSFYNRSTRTSMGFSTAGTNLSPEHKQKLSEALKGEKNPMFGKEHTPETKLKMSEVKTGEKNNMFGKNHSDETKLKMREAHKGVPQEQVQCPHCGKEGGISNMKRYHFDNCEYKKI
jgi:group I intron endonuclease